LFQTEVMEDDEELEDYALILMILAIQEELMPPARVPKHTGEAYF